MRKQRKTATKKAYQKQFHRRTRTAKGQGKVEPADAAQLTIDRTQVLQQMQGGLHRLGVSLGLELAALLMKDEVDRLCIRRYEHQPERQATRHGRQPGVVTIAGQKIGIDRPRVRSTRDDRELPLGSLRSGAPRGWHAGSGASTDGSRSVVP